LSELLSLPSSAADLSLSPQRKREKLLEALLNQLEAEARHRPVLMVFEDAQWIDPTSRELLDLSVDRVRHLPVCWLQRGDEGGEFDAWHDPNHHPDPAADRRAATMGL
jgi:predicted ATPase